MDTDTPVKRNYLVVYDYGMGGSWCVIRAKTSEEIENKYPKLKVIDKRPVWMADEHYNIIMKNRFIDIDEEPTGWFAGLMNEP